VFSSLATFADVVQHVAVTLARVHPRDAHPTTGAGVLCTVAITTGPDRRAEISARGRHPYEAIDRAATRIKQLLFRHGPVGERAAPGKSSSSGSALVVAGSPWPLARTYVRTAQRGTSWTPVHPASRRATTSIRVDQGRPPSMGVKSARRSRFPIPESMTVLVSAPSGP
jgi:hypothetical protein